VAPFSGGEKARLVLAMIVYQRPNLLLLDEPTNHLDLEMRHALALALQEFAGAMVVVSHDRYLLRSVTDRLVLVADGGAEPFDGDLDNEYPKWLAARRSRLTEPAAEAARPAPNRREQRRQDADKRRQLQPLRNRLKSLEQDLERLGGEKARIDAVLADNALYNDTEKEKLKALLQEQGRVQQALAQTETAWLEVCEALETADLAAIP
jgi:ATP-binding cassette subfamily F protein 3